MRTATHSVVGLQSVIPLWPSLCLLAEKRVVQERGCTCVQKDLYQEVVLRLQGATARDVEMGQGDDTDDSITCTRE
jgi:hypothetical protein